MKTVFRYEHINSKKGPYNAEWYYSEKLAENHNNKVRNPSIRTDLMGEFKDGYLSTCTSQANLRIWFKGYNTKINNHDFVLVRYKVKSYFETKSGKQVAFNPSHIIEREVLSY